MAFLRSLFIVTLATACYSPDIRECAVTCANADDCAPGQSCGGDGLCASEGVTCSAIASTDAGVDGAGTPPDAATPATVKLVVRIDGRGDVKIPSVGDCEGGNGQSQCMFDVKTGVAITLQVMPKNNWMFVRWEDACLGQSTAACTLTPTAALQVRARFAPTDDAQ
ncbi:MAG TPA: hypothetical protein VK427_16500 [Kofleriaceae bacterium]|nr:hypothetical protein [Kofleriaceae bacterium]